MNENSPTDAALPPHTEQYRPRYLAFAILGLLIVVAALFVVFTWIKNKPEPPIRESVEQLPFVTVLPVTLGEHTVPIQANGFVSAKYSTAIAAQVSGSVTSISDQLAIGHRVSKGDILVKLDRSDYLAAVANAKASIANAQSTYAQEQAKAAQAKRDSKRLNIKLTALALRKPQLQAAKAAIENAKAQLKLAQTNLARTTIIAPFNAVVQSRDISPGEFASTGKTLATLVAIDTFTVKLTLSSKEAQLIGVGNQVTLTNPITQQSRQAKIDRFAPEIDRTNRTIGVYVDIDKPLADDPILLNSYLTADISGKAIANSAWIPTSSLINNAFVWQKTGDDTIESVPVSVIYRRPSDALVLFSRPIENLIERPKDSFYEGEKVTTSNQMVTTKKSDTAQIDNEENSENVSDELNNQNKATTEDSNSPADKNTSAAGET